jgi:hypothetical protein
MGGKGQKYNMGCSKTGFLDLLDLAENLSYDVELVSSFPSP